MSEKTIHARVISTPGDALREARFNSDIAEQSFSIRTAYDKEPWFVQFERFQAIMDSQMPRRGISKSHRAIVKEAKEQGWSQVLILEDDVKFLDKRSLLRFLNISALIPKDCDLFFGGLYDGKISQEFSSYASVQGPISGLHCYIVKEKFYDKMLSADENWNLDHYMSSYLHPVIYCAYPMLVLQHDGYSYNAKINSVYNYKIKEKYKLYGK